MPNEPHVTTVIPTYCRPNLLRRAIRSVLLQTYPHFQVRVYDNASGDETPDVVAEFSKHDHRVKYHCHGENIGALNNFNYGMQHVTTPYFSILSDDDILMPEFYETALRGFEKHNDAMFSCATTLDADLQGNIHNELSPHWNEGFYEPPDGLLPMLKRQPAWTGIVFKKEISKTVGILDPDVGSAIDLDFVFRASARYPYVFSLKPVALHFPFASFSYNAIAVHEIWEGWRENIGQCSGLKDELNQWIATRDSKIQLEHFWPGWMKIIRNLTDNETIPEHIRKRAHDVLLKDLKGLLVLCGKKSIQQRNYGKASEAAGILWSQLHAKSKSLRLRRYLALHIIYDYLRAMFPSLQKYAEILRAFYNSHYKKKSATSTQKNAIPSYVAQSILIYIKLLQTNTPIEINSNTKNLIEG